MSDPKPKPVPKLPGVVPTQPPSPMVAWTAPDAIRVQWGDLVTVPPVTSWRIQYRETGTTAWTAVSNIAAAVRARTIPDLDAGTEHDVRLRATNSDGNSSDSDILTVTTQEIEAMGILQSDLTEVQIGIESTAGTLVAATRKIPYVSGSYQPIIERKTLEEKGTVLADTTDVVVRRGSELELTEELNTETLIAALLCSLAEVTPTDLAGAYQWLFTPSVTAPSGLSTATVEIAATDGSTDTYQGRFGFGRCTALSIEASSDTAQITTTWMGRAKQTLTTPAAVAVPPRWIVPAMLFSVYIDDTWAGIGTTKFGTMRSLSLDIDPGVTEALALAGRADLDAAYYRRGRIRGNSALVVDHDGDASDELQHWEDGDLRYIRLEATNGGTGAALRRIRFDLVSRYVDTPDVLSSDGPQHTLDLASMLRADSAANILRVAIVNGLASW